jgi:mono/diheme cytochrome c family protein
MRINASIGVLLCAITLVPRDARAWSDDGHRIVALVAEHYLLPQARDKISAMLSADTDALTAHDFVSEATWADSYADSDQATTHARYDHTRGWHFAEIDAGRPNIPNACYGQPPLPRGTPASQGPAKACIVDKIDQFAEELADPKLGSDERLLALKYLLNLVGDIHQPLRVVDEGNHHGADLAVTAPSMTPGDLFTVWDSVLVHRLEGVSSLGDTAHILISHISESDQQQWSTGAPQLWALEAHQLGVDRAYGMIRGYDDQGRAALQQPQMQEAVETVALQLSRAGVRLAYVLNEALAPASLAAVLPKSAPAGDRAAGLRFARPVCGVCHVVSPGQAPNPVALAPDFQAISRTRGISGPALREFLYGPHPTMPNIHLSQKQADDVIAYILGLRQMSSVH